MQLLLVLLVVSLEQDAVDKWKQKTLLGGRQPLVLVLERKWKVSGGRPFQLQFAAVAVMREAGTVGVFSPTD